MEISRFQLKRVNPFQGLVIDADVWRDAHSYHRDQQRLHILAFHKTGIVSGLEVTADSPADTSVTINPGLAIDSEGNMIIMPNKQRYRLQTQEKRLVYLIIQFREVPSEPYQPPDGGQPTRILEAYRLQERDQLPSDPYVELARIDYDPSLGVVKNAGNPAGPVKNEIDLRFRKDATTITPERASVPAPAVVSAPVVSAPKEIVTSPPRESSPSRETLTIGYLTLGNNGKNLHESGLRNLVRLLNRGGSLAVSLEETSLKKPLNRFDLVYITGNSRFELASEEQSALSGFLQSGGVVFGDGCSDSTGGIDSKGAKDFGLSFNRYASMFNRKLGIIQRGHPLLSSHHIFAEVPPGCEPGMLLEGGNMIYSGSDYGCAWNGGYTGQSLSRDVIRSACEIGENILSLARKGAADKR